MFVGIKLEWDYEKRILDMHVLGYVKNALHKYQHKGPAKPQHAPATEAPIAYGAKIQKATKDTSPIISAEQIKKIQEIVGTIAWYSQL